MSDELVTVAVNAEVCIGSGQCEMLEEETFFVNEDTVIAEINGDGRLPLDRAQRCVDTCPAQAISIVAEEATPAEDVSSRVEEPPGDGSRPAGDVSSRVEEPPGDGSRPAGDVSSRVEEPPGDGSRPAEEEA